MMQSRFNPASGGRVVAPNGQLAHDREIRGTLTEPCTDAPPVGLQKIGRRGKHVGNAVPEIDVPVAVIIDAISRTRMAGTGSGSWRQAIDTRGDGHRGR